MNLIPGRGVRRLLAGASAVLTLAYAAAAQTWTVVEDAEWCHESSWNATYCEVREITLAADRDIIAVDGGKNGGIRVEGWDRDEILVQAKIQVWDVSRSDRDEYLDEIELETGSEIRASGPPRNRDGNWGVSFRLLVPAESNLDLSADNGGISIAEVTGDIAFSARNGGARLAGVGGDVHGHTRNGALDITLEGDRWTGDGLDVQTRNGGVKLRVPEDYSARLLMSTDNGGFESDLPVSVPGKHDKHIRATLGDGGPLLRITTTNGGVSIRET